MTVTRRSSRSSPAASTPASWTALAAALLHGTPAGARPGRPAASRRRHLRPGRRYRCSPAGAGRAGRPAADPEGRAPTCCRGPAGWRLPADPAGAGDRSRRSACRWTSAPPPRPSRCTCAARSPSATGLPLPRLRPARGGLPAAPHHPPRPGRPDLPDQPDAFVHLPPSDRRAPVGLGHRPAPRRHRHRHQPRRRQTLHSHGPPPAAAA